jgi:ATP-dependent helicase/nuclease subunit B
MSGFLDGPAPRWFTIASHRPFLDDLAAGIWRELTPTGPEALADAVILVPNRRAARDLAQAFAQCAGGKGVLLPRLRVLGDLDEGDAPFETGDVAVDLPPAISEGRRRFELAGLAAANAHLIGCRLDAGSALDMADALSALLNGLQIEEAAWPVSSEDLVPAEMAAHWRTSADFLDAVLGAWQSRLAELGLMDQAARRVAATRAWTQRWERDPPTEVVIAAGSTGSTKATADLLAIVARAPQGCVVLPGLDLSLAESAWRQVDEQHPQGALSRLLERAGITRAQVKPWDPAAESEMSGRWRRRLINEALRPPDATADWLEVIGGLKAEADGADPIAEGFHGLSLISTRAEEECATAAALLLREALEVPGRTATLVTPDPALARRVQARLSRWNITADSSVGETLAGAPVAVLAGLVARFAADPADPVTLLAIVKHPLTRLGLDAAALADASETLERNAFRRERPRDWEAVAERLRQAVADGEALEARALAAIDLASRLRQALEPAAAPFVSEASAPSLAARGVAQALEALAAGPRGVTGAVWVGQAGVVLGEILTSLMHESAALPPVTRAGFVDLLDGLLTRAPLRAGGATHPRLSILGVLEARLARPDLIILAGLEEGVWPAGAAIDPFLSRPMRAALGLPPPERRIGLSAHDFAQAASAPEAVLLHCERRDGAPTVKSRWLWRLGALVEGAGLELPVRAGVLDWAEALDAPLPAPPPSLRGAPRPAPRPPVKTRPRRLSVTTVERWIRDPYAIYARHILRLEALERPGAEIDARARGTAVHAAFEDFARAWPEALPSDAQEKFEALLLEELERAGTPAPRMVREQALAANTAKWVVDFERRRRPGARLLVEQAGRMAFDAPGGAFVLSARADRIEARGGEADILDFKTGAAPTRKQVEQFLAPQLTLTGAILAAGGFTDLGPHVPRQLLYVRISGGRVPGKEEPRDGGEAPRLAGEALERLKTLVARYDDPSTPYLSWTAPQFMGRYGGDYDHLARLWEWSVIGDSDAGAEP